MTDGSVLLQDVRAALQPHGLFLRGTVNFAAEELAPALATGEAAKSIILIGHAGSSIWPAFERWRRTNAEATHPLDTWSKAVIRPVAAVFGATAFFPSDPPWQPFQRWAMRAEGLQPSPLGIFIHPEYGLWHGYLGALAFDQPLPQTGSAPAAHPCDLCRDKPCLTACPVKAVWPESFDVPACRSHLATEAGTSSCMTGGCLARAACPVGADYRYSPEQLQFHMAALGTGL
ncbi:ferredoxin [Pararhizobium sp.]|uniref:ferredoxin n=1 Tax=Pararhizobium sp. TaxID=1977563 RepID=UPI00271E1964|nr:ferredoxin [Pararhizobium sp.]MDO9418716.1 ferredoxin [Pararhizobium sp.]